MGVGGALFAHEVQDTQTVLRSMIASLLTPAPAHSDRLNSRGTEAVNYIIGEKMALSGTYELSLNVT